MIVAVAVGYRVDPVVGRTLLLYKSVYPSCFVPVVGKALLFSSPPLILWRSASSSIVTLPSFVLVSYRLGSALSEWFRCLIVSFHGFHYLCGIFYMALHIYDLYYIYQGTCSRYHERT